MSSKNIAISIIMPALNEEKNIVAAVSNTLAAFKDLDINGEVLVINDGSTDRTKELVFELGKKNKNVRLLNHDKPQGIGAAFWDGVDEAHGNIVSMFPGDNENDPWESLGYFKLLEQVDIVIPFVFNRGVRSVFRNTLSWVYRFIINTTFSVYFNYTNGTVLYRKSLLKELDFRSKSFFYQTDILVRLVKKGYLFAEVPYRLGMRGSGVSKAVSFPSLLKVIHGYVNLVKDIYYSKKGKNLDREFAEKSLTAERYGKENSLLRKG